MVSAGGSLSTNGNLIIESSIGEVTTGYYNASGFHFLVGFHQPNMLLLDEPTNLLTFILTYEIKAYPNPTRGLVNIFMDKTLQLNLRNIYLTDLRGVLVNSFPGNELNVYPVTLSLTPLHPGIYFMLLVFGDGRKETALV